MSRNAERVYSNISQHYKHFRKISCYVIYKAAYKLEKADESSLYVDKIHSHGN